MTYMVHRHPGTRASVVRIFNEILSHLKRDEGEVCAWIISGLGALGASPECEAAITAAVEGGILGNDEIAPQDALNGRVDWLAPENAGEDVLERFRYMDEDWREGRPNEALNSLLGRISEPQEPIRVGVRVGRNDPCPCGSGRKYKRCCGQSSRPE